jgi:hypothetical protein
MNRVRFAYVAACAGLALLAGTGVTVRSAAPRVIIDAVLPDMALGSFHSLLFPFASDQIVDDHGVRFGSLGSDIFPGESYNEFWTVTDRGPNGNPGRRTFVAPKFNPVILYVRVHDSVVRIIKALPITDAGGLPVTGLSNIPTFDETPWDFNGANQIAVNPNGVDTEGIVRTRDDHFWLVDEYSPSLLHLGPDGRIIDRFVPVDSQLATALANTPNYRVKKLLPAILNRRRHNRGFEGVAITPDETTLFLAMQSPLDYPTNALGRASRHVRILRFNIADERVTGEFVYHFDEVCTFLRQATGCAVAPGEMKISALVAESATTLLVLERTDTAAKIYRTDLSGATDILGTAWDNMAASPNASTPALESLASLATQGITALPKSLVVDLSTLPNMPNKIEGIAKVRGHILAVANDNDFGLVDNATFTAAGKLSNDTGVKSKILYVQLH